MSVCNILLSEGYYIYAAKLSKLLGTIVLLTSFNNHSAGSYDSTSNRLTIPSVMVGQMIYHNVIVELRHFLREGGSSTDGVSVAPLANALDAFSPNSEQLTIPLVNGLELTY